MVNRIFTPFAQKYLLKEGLLHDQGESMRMRIGIYTDLDWHWGVRYDDFYAGIARDYEKLIRQPFKLYACESGEASDDHIIERQPTWDMNAPLDDFDEDLLRRKEAPFEESPLKRRGWRMEHLAWYSPAHMNPAHRYGIHITRRGVAHVAQQVQALCPNEPLEIIQMAAVYKIYAHELCHAWIEDLACLFDFLQGERAVKKQRNYARTQARFNSYIFMEEAICNTAAYGWLREFLGVPRGIVREDIGLPRYNAQVILDAFTQWMRKQPRGYRDFLEIQKTPIRNELFVQNVFRLMIEVYGIVHHGHREYEMVEAIGLFFSMCVDSGGSLHRHFAECLTSDGELFRSHYSKSWDGLWSSKPPIHAVP